MTRQCAGDFGQRVVDRIAVGRGGDTHAGTGSTGRHAQCGFVLAIHLGGGRRRQGDRALGDAQVGGNEGNGIVAIGQRRVLCDGVWTDCNGFTRDARQAAGKGIARHQATVAAGNLRGVG